MTSERTFSFSACWPLLAPNFQSHSGVYDLPGGHLSSDGCCALQGLEGPASIVRFSGVAPPRGVARASQSTSHR